LVRKRSVEALAWYASHGYRHVNDGLRNDTHIGSPDAGTIHAIDEAMNVSKLTRPVVVHRGVQSVAVFGQGDRADLTGVEFVERAYSSTTADPVVADEFYGDGGGAILNILVPAGVGGIQLSRFGPKPPPGGYRPDSEEAELLIDRDLTYRIVGDRIVDGRRHLDAEIVITP
jgi:hypothetical protein